MESQKTVRKIVSRGTKGSFKLIAPPQTGGIIGSSLCPGLRSDSQSILLPEYMRNRNADAAYLAQIFGSGIFDPEIYKKYPEILGNGIGGAGSIISWLGNSQYWKKDWLF